MATAEFGVAALKPPDLVQKTDLVVQLALSALECNCNHEANSPKDVSGGCALLQVMRTQNRRAKPVRLVRFTKTSDGKELQISGKVEDKREIDGFQFLNDGFCIHDFSLVVSGRQGLYWSGEGGAR